MSEFSMDRAEKKAGTQEHGSHLVYEQVKQPPPLVQQSLSIIGSSADHYNLQDYGLDCLSVKSERSKPSDVGHHCMLVTPSRYRLQAAGTVAAARGRPVCVGVSFGGIPPGSLLPKAPFGNSE